MVDEREIQFQLGGGRGATALPKRKRLNHRGPLSIDVSHAWYFITICAEGHKPWVMTKRPPDGGANSGRAVAPRPPSDVPFFDFVAQTILCEARATHMLGIWRLLLFLVMPDHLHFIVQVPSDRPATALPVVVGNFKHLLAVRYGIRFQRDFFDTRLRDDLQVAEKFTYICNNPVRKGLCALAREWRQVISFDRVTGVERIHR